MARNYAVLPHAYLEEMSELSDAEFGRLVRALLHYSLSGAMPELALPERFFAARVRLQEDLYRMHYEQTVAQRRAAASKAAMTRWHPEQMGGTAAPVTKNDEFFRLTGLRDSPA